MEETTHFNKSNVRVTNLQVSTKKGNVLMRDISAVQLKAPASARFFGTIAHFLWLSCCRIGSERTHGSDAGRYCLGYHLSGLSVQRA
jgi:hypothetical protein